MFQTIFRMNVSFLSTDGATFAREAMCFPNGACPQSRDRSSIPGVGYVETIFFALQLANLSIYVFELV